MPPSRHNTDNLKFFLQNDEQNHRGKVFEAGDGVI